MTDGLIHTNGCIDRFMGGDSIGHCALQGEWRRKMSTRGEEEEEEEE